MSSTSDDRQKWALLIGINHYPNFAPRGQLSGCVNDIQVMRQVLETSFNFPESHVELLTDEQATREGILTAMKELVARVGQDDIVVFHYSGHGSQMTDLEGDEPDGLDETIVPYDSGRAPHPNRDIKDDEIYLWLKDLTAKTSAATLIFDCCHSGTIVRDDFGGEVRWVEADLRPAAELPPSPIPAAFRDALDGGRDVGPSGWLPLGEKYVLISGCSNDERACEVEEPAGVCHGALTFFLSQELRTAESGTTYRDVFEALAPRVSSRFPDQHPQLEGARDLEVFGIDRIEPMKFVPVVERSADGVILGGGAACGLIEGSQWAIYPAGTKVVAAGTKPLGRVELTAVRAVTSETRLLEEAQTGAVVAGMRAVEESRAVETRLPVEVVAPAGQDVQLLLDGLDASKLLRRAGPDGFAKVRVYLLAPRSQVDAETPVPMLGCLREETWAAVGEDGHLLMPVHQRFEPGIVQLLLDNLEKIARLRLTVDLRNDASQLKGKVDFELFRKTPRGLETPELDADNRPLFYEGDSVAMRLTSRHDRPLFVYILDLGLTGRIQLIYPPSGAEENLLPKVTFEVGSQTGREINLFIPDEFPYPAAAPGEAVEGIETLKLFVTTQPTDFQPLFQSGMRESRGPAGSLGDLLATTFGGGGTAVNRDMRPTEHQVAEDWTAIDRSFRVRRRASSRAAAGGRWI
jgi:hypothetical protein